MNKESIEKILSTFKEPTKRGGAVRPYVLFAYDAKNSRKGLNKDAPDVYVEVDEVGYHILPVDNALGQSSQVEHYVNKGFRIIKYFIPTEPGAYQNEYGDPNHWRELERTVKRFMGIANSEETIAELRAKETELQKRVRELEERDQSNKPAKR